MLAGRELLLAMPVRVMAQRVQHFGSEQAKCVSGVTFQGSGSKFDFCFGSGFQSVPINSPFDPYKFAPSAKFFLGQSQLGLGSHLKLSKVPISCGPSVAADGCWSGIGAGAPEEARMKRANRAKRGNWDSPTDDQNSRMSLKEANCFLIITDLGLIILYPISLSDYQLTHRVCAAVNENRRYASNSSSSSIAASSRRSRKRRRFLNGSSGDKGVRFAFLFPLWLTLRGLLLGRIPPLLAAQPHQVPDAFVHRGPLTIRADQGKLSKTRVEHGLNQIMIKKMIGIGQKVIGLTATRCSTRRLTSAQSRRRRLVA